MPTTAVQDHILLQVDRFDNKGVESEERPKSLGQELQALVDIERGANEPDDVRERVPFVYPPAEVRLEPEVPDRGGDLRPDPFNEA